MVSINGQNLWIACRKVVLTCACVCCCRCRNILAIQQNLTNITLTRETDLDRARQFYELLYLSPDVSA